jgi:hypothetical protein
MKTGWLKVDAVSIVTSVTGLIEVILIGVMLPYK